MNNVVPYKKFREKLERKKMPGRDRFRIRLWQKVVRWVIMSDHVAIPLLITICFVPMCWLSLSQGNWLGAILSATIAFIPGSRVLVALVGYAIETLGLRVERDSDDDDWPPRAA